MRQADVTMNLVTRRIPDRYLNSYYSQKRETGVTMNLATPKIPDRYLLITVKNEKDTRHNEPCKLPEYQTDTYLLQ